MVGVRACQGVKLSPSIDTRLCYPAVTPQVLGCHAGCGSFVAEAVITGWSPWDFLVISWAATTML